MRDRFIKWALTQKDFTLKNGVLTYFNFPFWELDESIQKAPINQFKLHEDEN